MIPSDLADQYPFESKYFAVNNAAQQNINMHYIDEGKEASEGECVLFVHGNPTWSFYFRSLLKHFRSSHRVIAPDHIGSGLSSKPQDYPYVLAQHIKNLSGLIEHLGLKKVHLVVHDWGGAIALGWAVQNPELLASLTISNTAAYTSKDIPKRIAFLRAPFVGEWLMRALNIFALAATKMAAKKTLSREAKLGLLLPYSSYDDRIGVARFVQDIPLDRSHTSYETLEHIEKNLNKLNVPKLILWGMKDFCFNPSFLKRWCSIYPEASLVKFDKAGHYLLEDAPKEFIHHLELFLDNNDEHCKPH